MKRILLILILVIVGSCVSSNFTKQKFTDLKALQPISEEYLTPPDSLQSKDTTDIDRIFQRLDSTSTPVYLQTEKGYYKVVEPSYDSKVYWVKAENIRLASIPEDRDVIVLYLTEKNFDMLDAVDLNKVDSVSVNNEIVRKPRKTAYYVNTKKDREKNKAKRTAGVVMLSAAGFFFILALYWFITAQTQDGSCTSIFVFFGALALTVVFGTIGIIFLVIGLVLTIGAAKDNSA